MSRRAPSLPRWGSRLAALCRSERGRLTAVYGGLLLLTGFTLIAMVWFLVHEGLPRSIEATVTDRGGVSASSGTLQEGGDAENASGAVLDRLTSACLIVLAVHAVVSIALAWWMAGRVLRPVSVITATARRLSGRNLHERIALNAPPGELKELADTLDGMLDRMQRLVSAQSHFAANAAHELRTPLAVQRAAAEVGLLDPAPQNVAYIRSKLLECADGSERLIEGLLLLAASGEGLERVKPVRLDEIATRVAEDRSKTAAVHGVTMDVTTEPCQVTGDPVLLHHLVHNLVENAIVHNVSGGRVGVRVDAGGVAVTNDGLWVPEELVTRLFEPFWRMRERLSTPGAGVGLGLSIVASIAEAHQAVPIARSNPDGGLTVRVSFPTGSRL